MKQIKEEELVNEEEGQSRLEKIRALVRKKKINKLKAKVDLWKNLS